jgi:integrase
MKIEVRGKKLYLRFSYMRKQHRIALGLDDTAAGWAIAKTKLAMLDADIKAGQYDETHKRYSAQVQQKHDNITTRDLFHRYVDTLRQTLADTTIRNKYDPCAKRLEEYFGAKPAYRVTAADAVKFRDWYRALVKNDVLRERLRYLNNAWEWGVEHQLLTTNVWAGLSKKIRVEERPTPNPFTQEELSRILRTLGTTPRFAHYYQFCYFLLAMGCRPGEAIALRWAMVNQTCSVVTFAGTKTGRIRKVPVTAEVTRLLLSMTRGRDEDVVFTTAKGKPINKSNFRQKVWTPLLELAGVAYRPPGTTRHTHISHALAQGKTAVEVGAIVGNSPRVIYEHYAGLINKQSLAVVIPDDIPVLPPDLA